MTGQERHLPSRGERIAMAQSLALWSIHEAVQESAPTPESWDGVLACSALAREGFGSFDGGDAERVMQAVHRLLVQRALLAVAEGLPRHRGLVTLERATALTNGLWNALRVRGPVALDDVDPNVRKVLHHLEQIVELHAANAAKAPLPPAPEATS